MEKIQGNQDHAKCPRCGQFEDASHIARCRGDGTDVVFEVAVQKVELKMGKSFTAPAILSALGTCICQWRKHSKGQTTDQETRLPRYRRHDEWGTQAAVAAQDKISWYNLLLGRMSHKWPDTQQKYLESLGKRTTQRRWTIAIISKLWDITWDMWQHCNHIKHNTLHPQKNLVMDSIAIRVNDLYKQGSARLLLRDKPLFQKSLETLKTGTYIEQEQWITSVLLANHRAEAAKTKRPASMSTEPSLMESWLGIIHETEEVTTAN